MRETALIHPISRIVEAAIHERITPGAVVLIARDAELLHLAAYGTTRYADPGSRPVAPDDIYDIASITKIFTATVALRLADAGVLDLERPVCEYLPALQARSITARHLLTHSSGLDLRLSALREQPPAAILQAVYAAPQIAAPGCRVAYTNINTLLLGLLLERISGQLLDSLIDHYLLTPLGLHTTGFRPAPPLLPRIVPSEYCEWRGGLVHGQVHDESAYALGGVCGHAGLFASAGDLWRFARLWLNQGVLDGQRYLRAQTIAEATRNQTPWLAPAAGQACGLGWMLDRPAFMGRQRDGAYGHTGFSGATLLIHPPRQLVFVLLANRVYPRRHPTRTHHLTAAIADLIAA